VGLGNWLPAPEGGFYLIIRLYRAKPEVMAGKWTPPVKQSNLKFT
jgi:hypothetical protein